MISDNIFFFTNRIDIKVHCHQIHVFLTTKDFWLLNINNQKSPTLHCFCSFSRLGNLSFTLSLAAFAVEDMAFSNSLRCLSVNSFLFSPYFLLALHRLVSLGLSSVIHHCGYINSLFVCWQLLLKGHHVVLMLHLSLIHQPLSSLLLLLLPLALEYVSALSSGDGRDLVISSLASRILSATFCSASTLFLSSSNFSAFSRAWNEVWVDHTDLFRSTLLWFPGWPLAGFSTNFNVNGKHLKGVKKKVFNIPFRKRGSPCRWSR